MWQPNRADLRWDNFDSFWGAEYSGDPDEDNTWLRLLNTSTLYDRKITAYWAYIGGDSSITALGALGVVALEEAIRSGDDFVRLRGAAVLLERILNPQLNTPFQSLTFVNNDGLVPRRSGAFDDHSLARRVECPGHDHSQMVLGNTPAHCANGLRLFESIRTDLLASVWTTPPPDVLVSGQPYSVSWQIVGGNSVTHANVHWDTVDPTDPARCNASTQPPCSTLNAAHGELPGAFSAVIVAPSVVAATPYRFVVHGVVDGQVVWSPVVSSSVQPALSPAISVTPASHDFGTVTQGGSSDRSFTVRNTGGGTLVGNATIPAPYSIVSSPGYTLAPGQLTNVIVRFAPSTAGTFLGAVTFSGGGGVSRLVTGTGVPASSLTILPSALDFGSVPVGAFRESTLVVANAGGGVVTGSVTTSLPFSIVTGGTFSLAPGQSQTITVRFAPLSVGAHTANASIVSSAGSATRVMSGGGTTASPLQSPTATTHPASAVSTNSARLNGQVNPNGFVATTWFEWGPTLAYGNVTPAQSLGSGITALSVDHLLGGLAPGSTYHFRIVAQNSAGIAQGANQTFTTSAATPSAICVTPSRVDFITTEGGPASFSESLTVWNCGGGTLNWAVTDDQDTWLSVTPPGGVSTGEADVASVSVNTAGLTASVRTGTITLTASGASNSPQTIPVTLIVTKTASGDISWANKTSMPVAGPVGASAVALDKIYVMGVGTYLTNYVYDPETNAWTQKASSPDGGLGDGGAAVVGTKIYTIGNAGNFKLRIYDIAADSWTASVVPGPVRRAPGVAAVNDKVYVIGGTDLTLGGLSDVQEFNPDTSTWTTKASLPTPRGFAAVAVWNNLIYVIGGVDYIQPESDLKVVEAYDPVTNAWMSKASMPTRRRGASTGIVADRVFVIGGFCTDDCSPLGMHDVVEEYDPVIDVWRTNNPITSTPRWLAAAGVIRDKLYVIAGEHTDFGTFVTTPLSSVQEGTLIGEILPPSPSGLQATAVSDNRIDLTWSYASNKAAAFKLERSTSPTGVYVDIATLGSTSRSHADVGLAPLTPYVYRIRAFNSGGDSAASNEASATTLGASIAFQPGSWDYGSVVVGSTSDKDFSIQNTATVTLAVSATSIVGTDPGQFSIVSGGGAFMVAPGGSHTVTVRFVPTSAGSKGATFRVASNDPNGPSDAALSGVGQVSLPTLPTLATFAINGGAGSTISRVVVLDHTTLGLPMEYQASESSGFTGAAWQPYSTAPSFTLSAGNGAKRVYFRVRNTAGMSSTRNDTITLNEPTPVVTTFSVNSGSSSTTSRLITLNNIATGSPTEYQASESSSFAGAAWQPYATAPSFTLSAGNGTKRVYFQVRSATGTASAARTDTITLNEPVPTVATFAVNGGAASTTTPVVALNNTATGNPTEYQASESSSFTGAAWQPYATAPNFTLSAGNGTKQVYFRVRNATGAMSTARNDTITLNEPMPMVATFALNGGATSTTSPVVALNNTATGSPTEYQASESSSFAGAVWQPYAAAPSFTLSSGNGVKRVYFRVRNAGGAASTARNDTISLSQPVPVVGTLAINGGVTSTTSPAVALNNTVTGSATEYQASESSSFAGAVWQPYAAAPSFTLSSGNGVKRVYFRVRNAAGTVSASRNDTITLSQ